MRLTTAPQWDIVLRRCDNSECRALYSALHSEVEANPEMRYCLKCRLERDAAND